MHIKNYHLKCPSSRPRHASPSNWTATKGKGLFTLQVNFSNLPISASSSLTCFIHRTVGNGGW